MKENIITSSSSLRYPDWKLIQQIEDFANHSNRRRLQPSSNSPFKQAAGS